MKTFLKEEKIEETIKRIPKSSFSVFNFIEIFKELYLEDWKRLVERFLWIMDWMKKHQKPGWKMRFYDAEAYTLPEVAYNVSLRDQSEDVKVKTSRVTLILLKKENEWKNVHGYFSYVPK